MRSSIWRLTRRLQDRSAFYAPSQAWVCRGCQQRLNSTTTSTNEPITVQEHQYETDEWTNAPAQILSSVSRRLHLQKDHPITITRKIIESRFPGFKTHNSLFPVVTTYQNFDSLGFQPDHPGRSRTDTYYVNKNTVLRTHTSAHQADVFRANESDGYLISADVYRRDAVDRSHYPIFHQMEAALTWDSNSLNGESLAKRVWEDLEALPKNSIEVLDENPTIHPERNPLQQEHKQEDVEAIAAHLKKSLENVVVEIFARAAESSKSTTNNVTEAPLKVRWVEAYFPFTSPSWELEVFWQDEWLEVLGCGVVKQQLLNNAGVPTRSGWAFGIGLERIAMILFNIPDIRLFWSQDPRFLSQFSESAQPLVSRFVPFSKHPACYKDISFWLRSSSAAGGMVKGTTSDFHENDFMELVRDVCGDLVEDVRLTDEFAHPKSGRRSMCYRINYRSLERTLTNEETNGMHERVRQALVEKMGVELR
ncbi:phenylalanyl-tRNA synthetase [Microthyrium microscopicum]|uniref:Phenylalanine--tRNA ligase, mitochondrial n=1 Tax=Microthyrium microscopicum TaxID=703497 RepID=A0A6A6UBU7_9PEZI|nr:phenylalanyl-tRNA synthetase [Microthyrium microscopicum]